MHRTVALLSQIPLFLRVVSVYCVIGGLCVVYVMLYPADNSQVNAYGRETLALGQKITSGKYITGTPLRIIIPRVGVDLPVVGGKYDAQSDSWTLTNDKAQFMTTSMKPNNNRGNTFIYGHNRPEVFEKTRDLKRGDEVRVITSNKHTFLYRYVDDVIVDPGSTDLLAMSPITPRLTLMTCSGFWSEHRRLMYFEFTEVV